MNSAPEPALPPALQKQAGTVLARACDLERPLATAESCTGGLLAALLTDVEGCSHIFERGFVVYSSQSKCDLLGLESELIERCGAVSREVALAMAGGALARSEADLALAITGYAGPPGKDEEGEEGLVHFACASNGGAMMHREKHYGAIGREAIRVAALETALDMIGKALDR